MRERVTWPGESTETLRPSQRSFAEIFEFGEQLIQTNDLDPVYNIILDVHLEHDQLLRLLLAYFCFYHLGAAAYISEFKGQDYWATMEEAARNDGLWCPRGAERRHFRGDKCVQAVKWLESRCTYGKSIVNGPENLVACLCARQASEVITRIMRWPMFGDWIAFKAADMIDRLVVPVEFSIDIAWLYKEPREGLNLLPTDPIDATMTLLKHFSKFKAPPRRERWCNIQEVETILCKFKSFVNGHYWVGKDISEVRAGLSGWGETARQMYAVAPHEVDTRRGKLW